MKDVISILQSRVAKRSNEIHKFSDDTYEGRLSLVDGEYVESAALCNLLAKEQKQDKRILAEIVQLRRELKSEKEGRKAVLDLGCDRIEAHAKALEKCRKEVEELRAQIKELDAILDRFYRAEEI